MKAHIKIPRVFGKPKNLLLLFFFICLSILCSFWEKELLKAPYATVVETNGSVRLFANQTNNDLTALLSAAISGAKESVRLIVYTLTDHNIISALRNKSQEGISVSVIYDATASPNVNRKLGKKVHSTRCIAQGRMHQKILVIDSNQVWIGSANMTTESLHMHGNLVTTIEHPELARHILSKSDTVTMNGFKHSFPHEEFNIGGQEVELSFLPDDTAALERIKRLIKGAQKTIRIAMFTWTRLDLAQEVVEASNRGVDVEVVIDSYQGKGASAKIVKMLKENRIQVSLSPGGTLLHHKFLYIDKTTLVNGSANWTKAAFNQNDECFLILHGLNNKQQEQMEALWNVIKTESRSSQYFISISESKFRNMLYNPNSELIPTQSLSICI